MNCIIFKLKSIIWYCIAIKIINYRLRVLLQSKSALNKSCSACNNIHFLFVNFFQPNIFRPMVKKNVLGRPFWKIWKAPNLHSGPMRFRKWIAYIVNNRSMIAYLNICIYFNFGELKKKWPKMRKSLENLDFMIFF